MFYAEHYLSDISWIVIAALFRVCHVFALRLIFRLLIYSLGRVE
jgi:hypothetical protein